MSLALVFDVAHERQLSTTRVYGHVTDFHEHREELLYRFPKNASLNFTVTEKISLVNVSLQHEKAGLLHSFDINSNVLLTSINERICFVCRECSFSTKKCQRLEDDTYIRVYCTVLYIQERQMISLVDFVCVLSSLVLDDYYVFFF